MIRLICGICGAPFPVLDEVYEKLMETTGEVFCQACGGAQPLKTREQYELIALRKENERLKDNNRTLIVAVEGSNAEITRLQGIVNSRENPIDVIGLDGPILLVVDEAEKLVFLNDYPVFNKATKHGCRAWSKNQLDVLLVFMSNPGKFLGRKHFKAVSSGPWKIYREWVKGLDRLFTANSTGLKKLNLREDQVKVINKKETTS